MPLDVARMWHDFSMADKDRWFSIGGFIGAGIGIAISRQMSFGTWVQIVVVIVFGTLGAGIQELIQNRKS
jgi:uncharacterized membrane protein